MQDLDRKEFREVELPWSAGTLSARLWQVGERSVVGVPELGMHCFGATETEAVFRLFTALLKYYRQLKAYKERLSERGVAHLELLTGWVQTIEERMKAPKIEGSNVKEFARPKRR